MFAGALEILISIYTGFHLKLILPTLFGWNTADS